MGDFNDLTLDELEQSEEDTNRGAARIDTILKQLEVVYFTTYFIYLITMYKRKRSDEK